MGLDNIPHHYPCDRAGTSVRVALKDREGNVLMDDETNVPMTQIKCDDTIENGGCPYKNAHAKSGLASGGVTGMLGTYCWYRGKFGNYLLEAMDIDENVWNFYGDNEEGTFKTAESCRALADEMERVKAEHGKVLMDGEDMTDEVDYAIWYLRWAAEHCDGLDAWY